MAKDLTGFRIAHADLLSVATGATGEEQEMDFDFARGEGMAIYSVEFKCEINAVANTAFADLTASFTLHVENDTLETTMVDVPADGFTTDDSEIIAEGIFGGITQAEAATRGGSAAALAWFGPNKWDYLNMLGSPLIIAINPTFRVGLVGATLVLAVVRCTIWYKYVELSDRDIRDAFFRRR